MNKLKKSSLGGNTGHFVNEFGLPDSEASEGMKIDNMDVRKVVSSSLIALDHMSKLKNIAFVGNTGHFDIEFNNGHGEIAHFSPGPAVVRRLPGRSVPGQRRTKNPRCVLIKWPLPASLAHHRGFVRAVDVAASL